MLHSLVLEKNRIPSPEKLKQESPEEPAIGSDDEFVYMLVPHAQGYKVMRTPLDRFLAIAEPVSEIPRTSGKAQFITDSDPTDPRGAHKRRRAEKEMQVSIERNTPRIGVTCVRFGNVEIDAAARVVTVSGNQIPLAPLEFDLLLALFERGGAAVSRNELMREIWGGRSGVTSRTVDTHIFNLRRKLETDPSRPVHLLTVSKVGYRLKA